MNKKSEGIRRMALIFSFVFVVAWVIYFTAATNGFSPRKVGGPVGWLIFIVGLPVTFYIPQLITKVVYWVKDGFDKD